MFWLEYFKFELKFIEKVKLRKAILQADAVLQPDAMEVMIKIGFMSNKII